jgi:Fur family ferric uptake transcriptional regulator
MATSGRSQGLEASPVHALPTVGQTQFGLAHEPHHHAICTGCGKVSELPGATLTDILQALEQHTGYTFTDNSSLTMRALCEQCRHSRQQAQPDR